MGLEYITQPQVFLAPISAQQGIRGLIENYPLLTTFQSWTSTTNTSTTALNIGGFWTMLETPAMTGEVVPESFIVTVGGVVQAPNNYRIFNYPTRKITFDATVPAGIAVNLTQLATHSPSSQRFNYLKADSALITNLTSTTVVFVTSFSVTENLSAFSVTDIVAQNTLSAGIINTNSINSTTILSANTNLYNLFLPIQGGTLSDNSSNPILTIVQTGSGAALRVEDVVLDTTPFVIDSEGKVGIGKEVPIQTLDLETTNTTGASIVRISSDTLPGSLLLGKTRGIPSVKTAVLAGDVLGQIVFQGFDTGGSINNAASIEGLVASTVGLSSVPAALVFKTNAAAATTPTEHMRIASTGRVGIGTASPTERLTVSGNISASGIAQLSAFVANSGKFANNENSDYLLIEPSDDSFRFFSNGSEILRATSTGNVGIGTTIPNQKLTVVGSISAYSTDPSPLTLDRPSVLSVSCAFKNNSGITYAGRPSNTNSDDIFSVGTSNNLLSNPSFFINSAGNVGIGTTTPNERLTISGNLSASGTIQAGGLSVPRKFATSITGSALSYTITHNLGTRDVVVSVYDTASPYSVILTTVAHSTTNTVTVEFNPAPGASTYRVVVIG